MATMYEIYEKHSYEYDELINREDCDKNLPAALKSIFDFKGKTVIEFGTGTGRLTKMYISDAKRAFCYDRSPHMLEKARINLSPFANKIDFNLCDNNHIDSVSQKADFVIEGWSFGHTVSDKPEEADNVIDDLVSHSLNLLHGGGSAIFIETLGSDSEKAHAPTSELDHYYRRLESLHRFERVEIRTDYLFDSVEEASRIFGFFFGDEAGKRIEEKGQSRIREYTGIWHRTK